MILLVLGGERGIAGFALFAVACSARNACARPRCTEAPITPGCRRAIWGSNPLTFQPSKKTGIETGLFTWRRDGDSNPRYGCPHTHFPGVLLQPLGHLSTELEYPYYILWGS
jgi:hypothetical protein